jgi:rhodanese-related sulfurtransferase
MVPVSAQIVRLCVLAATLSGLLGVVRGIPKIGAAGAGGAATGVCEAPVESAATGVRFISAAEARALVGDSGVAFVDCRPRGEFEAGHVAGSVHVEAELGTLPAATLERVRAAQTVVTYCDAREECERSLRIANLIAAAGAQDVRVLEGGMPAWLSEGLPAESGACRDCEGQP